jgi:hypothetical protein
MISKLFANFAVPVIHIANTFDVNDYIGLNE